MASKVDMSLDDIIKSNRSLRRGRGRGRGGRGGGAGVTRGGSRGRGFARGGLRGRGRGRARGGSYRSDSSLRQVQSGRIGKSPRGGFSSGSISTRWEHDRFEGGSGLRRGGIVSPGRASVKLVISNLDFGVNDQDLKELFGEFGGFVKANVHYDISGRSNGTAFIIMNSIEAAEQARKRYHGVQLDGRPMDIQIMGGNTASARIPVAQRFSPARGRGARGASRGGFKRGRGRGGRGRGSGPTPTKKELDDELDMYNAQSD